MRRSALCELEGGGVVGGVGVVRDWVVLTGRFELDGRGASGLGHDLGLPVSSALFRQYRHIPVGD